MWESWSAVSDFFSELAKHALLLLLMLLAALRMLHTSSMSISSLEICALVCGSVKRRLVGGG